LLGEPFSFYPESTTGIQGDGPALFTGVDYRTQSEVVAARSRFSFGIDPWMPPPLLAQRPGRKVLAWLGQFQWARASRRWTRSSVQDRPQISNQPLLPLEQIAVGADHRAGYRENLLVRDQALIASLECGSPWFRTQPGRSICRSSPFQITVMQKTGIFRALTPGAFTAWSWPSLGVPLYEVPGRTQAGL